MEGLRFAGVGRRAGVQLVERAPPQRPGNTGTTPGGDHGPGWEEFVQAYEEHFQRSLRSPTPALGYDAARLLIEANRRGDGTPEGTLRALERIRDFPGATGLLSIVDGRIQRTYLPVRIDARRLIPILPEPFPDPR
jgi:ABC-type branched-subunit amino acid transport system substrate-binding protein